MHPKRPIDDSIQQPVLPVRRLQATATSNHHHDDQHPSPTLSNVRTIDHRSMTPLNISNAQTGDMNQHPVGNSFTTTSTNTSLGCGVIADTSIDIPPSVPIVSTREAPLYTYDKVDEQNNNEVSYRLTSACHISYGIQSGNRRNHTFSGL